MVLDNFRVHAKLGSFRWCIGAVATQNLSEKFITLRQKFWQGVKMQICKIPLYDLSFICVCSSQESDKNDGIISQWYGLHHN